MGREILRFAQDDRAQVARFLRKLEDWAARSFASLRMTDGVKALADVGGALAARSFASLRMTDGVKALAQEGGELAARSFASLRMTGLDLSGA